MKQLVLAAAAGLWLALLPAQPVLGADNIKFIVPFSAGGATDATARLIAEYLNQKYSAGMVVENRPGANGNIGQEIVARAAPDGNTIMIGSNNMVIDPHMMKLTYDPLTAYEPVCKVVVAPTVYFVPAESPYRTLGDLLQAAREKPGQLSLASIGPLGQFFIGFEMLRRAANVEITFVPFPGMAPALGAVLGNHVTAMLGSYQTVSEQLKSGKVRALATGSAARLEALPDLPTVAEQGFAGYEIDNWFGVFLPAKTPKETVAKMAAWVTEAIQAPEVKAKLVAQGLFPAGICGEAFARQMKQQFDTYGKFIAEANIKAQ